MSEERRKILEMVADGKISVEEAEKLLSALSESSGEAEQAVPSGPKSKPRYMRIIVEPSSETGKGEKVNIRVPMKLLRAGIKLASLVPVEAQGKVENALKEKGLNIDLSQITKDNLEEIIESLSDLTVDVEGEEKVRIYCE